MARTSEHWTKGLEGRSINYTENVEIRNGGIYNGNIPWMLKLTASYQLPYGVRMGAFLNTRAGFPRNDRFPTSRWEGNRYSTIYFDCCQHGGEYNDTYYYLDLRLRKPLTPVLPTSTG